MKKNLIKALILTIVLVGCADDIEDVRPENALEVNDFFSTSADFTAALGGAFQQLQNYYALELMIAGDIPADNVVQSQTGRQSNDVYWDWRYTSNNDIGLLDEAYEAVNIANLIIKNLDVLPEGDARNNFEGQARVIRALAHFDMTRVYGQIPTQSAGAGASLGVSYERFEDGDVDDPLRQPARETIDSNYTEILEDLTAALALVDSSSDNVENNFTVESIQALLSRVYLYMGRWSDVVTSANAVTTTVSARENVAGVFRDANVDGVITKMAINQITDGLSAGVVWSQSSTTNTISEYAMAFDLFQSIDATDIRGEAYVFTGTNNGQQYNAILKWLGETGQINGTTDMPILRAAEVILNKAEAQFELGSEGDALATLNQLRNNRYDGAIPGGGNETGAALEAAIQYERRLEFFAEYHRWFDIKRRGLAVNRANFGDLADGTGTAPEIPNLPAGDFRFQLPIPQSEIQVNPNFSQNPGYE